MRPDTAKDKKLVLIHAPAVAFKEAFAPDDFGGQKRIRFAEYDEVDPLDAEKILQGLSETDFLLNGPCSARKQDPDIDS